MLFRLVGDWIKKVFTFGGEKYTGSSIYAGVPESTIENRLQRKFGDTNPLDLEMTRKFGQAGVDFGTSFNEVAGSTGIDLTQAPVNPYLFGDEPAGQRWFWRGRVYVDELGSWINIDLIFPGEITADELRDEFRREAERRIRRSPQGFGFGGGPDLTPSQVEIIFGERRF